MQTTGALTRLRLVLSVIMLSKPSGWQDLHEHTDTGIRLLDNSLLDHATGF